MNYTHNSVGGVESCIQTKLKKSLGQNRNKSKIRILGYKFKQITYEIIKYCTTNILHNIYYI